MTFDQAFITRKINQSAAVIQDLVSQSQAIETLGDRVRNCFASGGTVYTCGNGGSAAEAMHLAEELIGKYNQSRAPLPAICLNADPTALTCIANDFGFDEVFARQVEALVKPEDILVIFSTSGQSTNIVRALEVARAKGATTLGLLGKGGGPCAPLCDEALIVDSQHTEHIQEAHQVVLHLILEAVESAGAPEGVTDETARAQ